MLSWVRQLESSNAGFANSLFLARLLEYQRHKRNERFENHFPRGVPAFSEKHNFILETAIDWIVSNLIRSHSPHISYVHLYPPHGPYRTRWDYIDAFAKDGFKPVHKPRHPLRNLGNKEVHYEIQIEGRCWYDEFILYVDSEFQRLMDGLEKQKILDETIVILTSDHGEMFERGIPEHLIPSFHKPLMHVPLLIFLPGQKERADIHSLTTTVDLLPTLLQLSGKVMPSWLEGEILPPFNTQTKNDRAVFSMDLRHNSKDGPVENGTFMLRKGKHKLTYLFGTEHHYEKLEGETLFELYNLEDDPEELINLYNKNEPLTGDMLDELRAKLAEKNLPKMWLESPLLELWG